MATFGSRLKQLRNEKELTQRELGELFKISESSVGMYERDEREPSFELLGRMASEFQVSIDYLLGFTNTRIHVPPSNEIKTIKELIKEGNLHWDKGFKIPEDTPEDKLDWLLDMFESGLKKEQNKKHK